MHLAQGTPRRMASCLSFRVLLEAAHPSFPITSCESGPEVAGGHTMEEERGFWWWKEGPVRHCIERKAAMNTFCILPCCVGFRAGAPVSFDRRLQGGCCPGLWCISEPAFHRENRPFLGSLAPEGWTV